MIGRHVVATGVAGFIGSPLAEALLAEGRHVSGVDRRDPAHDPAVADQLAPCLGTDAFTFAPGDLAVMPLAAVIEGAGC
ncbi:GDP-mannose 4,6-dehydratase [Streptomyces sp. NPDC050508]|uniref:NAD-dependent epimerase/dehydratase family protein n=1 Tax=Streptomyces sp. NPDC050508 TaxID=3155405 RepID=UPI00342D21B2